MISDQQFEVLEQCLLDDPGRRGVSDLFCPGDLFASCMALSKAKNVCIVSGFYIPRARACETDGPPGAACLQHVLSSLGIPTVVLTDEYCRPVLESVCRNVATKNDAATDCDVLISVERLGRSADGHYYNMRGIDIGEWTPSLDEIFLSKRPDVISIGIGDGGNEIGMGKVHARIVGRMPKACIVETDHLITAGVSNWGAWAIAIGLSLLVHGEMVTCEQARADLDRCLAAGAVDGITGVSTPTVDGLDWSVHEKKLQTMLDWAAGARQST